jgi:hypothetical protein
MEKAPPPLSSGQGWRLYALVTPTSPNAIPRPLVDPVRQYGLFVLVTASSPFFAVSILSGDVVFSTQTVEEIPRCAEG